MARPGPAQRPCLHTRRQGPHSHPVHARPERRRRAAGAGCDRCAYGRRARAAVFKRGGDGDRAAAGGGGVAAASARPGNQPCHHHRGGVCWAAPPQRRVRISARPRKGSTQGRGQSGARAERGRRRAQRTCSTGSLHGAGQRAVPVAPAQSVPGLLSMQCLCVQLTLYTRLSADGEGPVIGEVSSRLPAAEGGSLRRGQRMCVRGRQPLHPRLCRAPVTGSFSWVTCHSRCALRRAKRPRRALALRTRPDGKASTNCAVGAALRSVSFQTMLHYSAAKHFE